MKGAIFSVVACVLVLNIGVSSALNCYVCTKTNETGDVECDADPIKPDPVACTATAPLVPHCIRLDAKVQVGEDIVPIISRQCVPLPADTQVGCITEFPGYTDVEYCICNTDNCNGHEIPVPTTDATDAPTSTGRPVDSSTDNNPAGQTLVAHFSLPLLGLALRQTFALL